MHLTLSRFGAGHTWVGAPYCHFFGADSTCLKDRACVIATSPRGNYCTQCPSGQDCAGSCSQFENEDSCVAVTCAWDYSSSSCRDYTGPGGPATTEDPSASSTPGFETCDMPKKTLDYTTGFPTCRNATCYDYVNFYSSYCSANYSCQPLTIHVTDEGGTQQQKFCYPEGGSPMCSALYSVELCTSENASAYCSWSTDLRKCYQSRLGAYWGVSA